MMENACVLCFNLVVQHKPHPALKKISEIKGSELYKCCCCYAYLHKHNDDWEVISGGKFSGEGGYTLDADLQDSFSSGNQTLRATGS